MSALARLDHHNDGQRAPGEWVLAELAARQHGVVARRQLAALGLGKGAIDRRVATGRLHPVRRGVYAVGHARLIGRGRWMAAVLACGPSALLSHPSGAALLDLLPTSSAFIHVTVSSHTGRRRRHGLVVHSARSIHPDDRTIVDCIPVTSVARTLLDLAETENRARLERAFEQAERLDVLDLRAIEALIARSQGRRGLAPLIALLDSYRATPPEFRSNHERRFLELCRAAGLPLPQVNVCVPFLGFEVDFFWPEQRLVVEIDSRTYHLTTAAFERDRERDTALQLARIRVIRITERRLLEWPDEVVADVARLLALAVTSRPPAPGPA